MMEFLGENLTYAFCQKHPSSYLFNDILEYVMKLKLLGKQRRLSRNKAQKLELKLKFYRKASIVKTDVVYLLTLIISIIQEEV